MVREAVARHGVGHLPGIFGSGPGVLAGVGEPLRSTHLQPVLAGEKRAGFAFTEPVDLPRPTWARIDGDELVVNGRKSYVTGGADVDFLTATMDVEGEGPAMVVIDVDRPGVVLTRRFASFDGSHHAAFSFTDVRVPRSCVLGAPGEGRGRALEKISEVRRAIAADCVGTAAWMLDIVGAHLQTPRRDGRRPGDLERVRLRYGDLRMKAYAARSMVYRTARLADAGHNVVNESIAAKLFSSEVAGEIADTAIQLLGGEALVEGHPIELHLSPSAHPAPGRGRERPAAGQHRPRRPRPQPGTVVTAPGRPTTVIVASTLPLIAWWNGQNRVASSQRASASACSMAGSSTTRSTSSRLVRSAARPMRTSAVAPSPASSPGSRRARRSACSTANTMQPA